MKNWSYFLSLKNVYDDAPAAKILVLFLKFSGNW